MNKKRLILFLTILFSVNSFADNIPHIDSLMVRITNAAEKYSKYTNNYEAKVYLKTNIKTVKKNFLYRFTKFLPDFVLHDSKNDQGLIESISKLRYEYPGNYFQDIRNVSGTMTRKKDIAMLPFHFISIGIYEKNAPGELFYLPLRKISLQYYDYQIAYVDTTTNPKIYSINFIPKYKNPQLISGYFMVQEGDWRVLGLSGEGTDLFVDFSFNVKMGDTSRDWFLPSEFKLKETYKYLGNKVENFYEAVIKYKNTNYNTKSEYEKNYNLGNRYRVRMDSVPIVNNPAFWDSIRPIPLSSDEKQLLAKHYEKEKNKEIIPDSIKEQKDYNRKLAQTMVTNTKYHYKSTDIRYSGLLNPTMLGYSTRDGLSYKQSLNLAIDLERQQRININANAGMLFKKKQFSYNVETVWNYEPAKYGYLSLNIGKGNPTYSTYFLKQLSDSIDSTEDIDLGYYEDFFIKIYNSIEITNGLQLGAGIDYDIRKPNSIPEHEDPNLDQILSTKYHFVPMVSLTWTPHQYYVTDRNQKIYVRSKYPTFKFEYARSLENVLKSTSSYSRAEFDISQCIRFDMMKNLNYHLGTGVFIRQKNEFFNDFTYFRKNHFPQSWGDGIGGSFNVLPTRSFNASDKYFQIHAMYETSKFLFTRLPHLANGVAKERVYISQLHTVSRPSYTEIGYGIGNRFLNAAIFVGFNNIKYYNISAKAVFLL